MKIYHFSLLDSICIDETITRFVVYIYEEDVITTLFRSPMNTWEFDLYIRNKEDIPDRPEWDQTDQYRLIEVP